MNETTEKKLKDALLRLKHGKTKIVSSDRKINIRSLAEEAGVSDSTIHNRYPSIASEVRELIDQTYKSQYFGHFLLNLIRYDEGSSFNIASTFNYA